jgi:tetratricopeptide (TPR) repeat protein
LAGADRLYAEAFEWYGLEVAAVSPEEAAQRIGASGIGTHLVAALDDWAFSKDLLHRGAGASLRALADVADDDPWRQRLRAAAMHGDRATLEALAADQDAMHKSPGNLVLLARALVAARRGAAAEHLLRRALHARPADFWLNFELAAVLDHKRPADPGELARFLQAALTLRPESPVVYLNLGAALDEQKKLAEAAYRKAIELKHNYADAYSNLGHVLRRQKRLAEAETALRIAIKLRPSLAAAQHNLGNALRDQQKLAEAEAAFREAITLKPDLAQAHYSLGITLSDQKK